MLNIEQLIHASRKLGPLFADRPKPEIAASYAVSKETHNRILKEATKSGFLDPDFHKGEVQMSDKEFKQVRKEFLPKEEEHPFYNTTLIELLKILTEARNKTDEAQTLEDIVVRELTRRVEGILK